MRRFVLIAAGVAALGFAGEALAALPGVRVVPVVQAEDFCSSIAFDSRGNLYYTTTNGGLYRVNADASSTSIAKLPTRFNGNAGLLGMDLFDDDHAAIHYTLATTVDSDQPAWEVISKIDLRNGAETVLAKIPDDVLDPGQPVSGEHHGGIPAVAEDGSVYVGVGDFFAFTIAPDMKWYGGKILRVDPDGKVTIVASGFRNPYGIEWDGANKRLIVPDNGEHYDDEINIVTQAGGFFGWPYTMGSRPPVDGSVAPIYTYADVTAPTGMTAVNGKNPYLRSGYLIGGYVTRSVDYVPDIDARPLPAPIAIISRDTMPVIDVEEAPNGDVYVATAFTIFRVTLPSRGDCNGDGVVDASDADALVKELADGDPHSTLRAQEGMYAGSWGCDANVDGVISSADRTALGEMTRRRVRAVRW